MSKNKKIVKKKAIQNKKSTVSKNISIQLKKSSSWIWYVFWALLILIVLFFVYKGMTGNVITGNASSPLSSIWDGGLKDALQYILGWDIKGDTNNNYKMDDFFSMALLILLVVFSIVFVVVKSIPFFNNPDHSWSVWVVSISVSILSVRFLTAEWLITILLPYSTFGVAISAGLPFVLFFFLVDKFPHTKNKMGTLQKIAWVFFGIIFLYLWYSRTHGSSTPALDNDPYYDVYLWTSVAALFMASYGQKAGGKVKAAISGDKSKKTMTKARANRELGALHVIEQNLKTRLDNKVAAGEVNDNEYKKIKQELDKVSKKIVELEGVAFS